MSKSLSKVCLFVVICTIPVSAFATYSDCRAAGGGFWGCFYGAAMNDRIIAPSGDSTKPVSKYTEAQLKDSFEKNKEACGKVAVEKQVECLTKKIKPVVAKPVSKPIVAKPVSTPSVVKPVVSEKVIHKSVSKPAVVK